MKTARWVAQNEDGTYAVGEGDVEIATCKNREDAMRLKEPEQEPVAWRTFDGEGNYEYRDYEMNENYDKEWAERNPNHAHWVQPLIVKEKNSP